MKVGFHVVVTLLGLSQCHSLQENLALGRYCNTVFSHNKHVIKNHLLGTCLLECFQLIRLQIDPLKGANN